MQKFVQYLAIGAAKVFVILSIVLVVAEAYIRWSLNQNFTFLGGETLPALLICSTALVIALLFVYRPAK